MMNSKKWHFKKEWETWVRTLDYIQQENVFLKNCIADIIKNDIRQDMLEQVEYFQNQFVNKDAIIALLRYDIANQNRFSEHGFERNGEFTKLQARQSKLRSDMEKMENEFSKLKFQFNTYLAEVS